MLETIFPRMKGDIGNPNTFPFPVRYKIVKGATIERAVKTGDPSLIAPFVEVAKELERDGIKAITTSCGFLALFQKEIKRELNIPFYSSSLMQIPFVHTLVDQKGTIGVITAKKSSLTRRHLEGAGVQDTPVAITGMDDMPEFTRVIIENSKDMDTHKIEKELVTKAQFLVDHHRDIQAVVLECTNMPPYRESIKRAVRLPVFDIITLTEYVYAALP